MDYLIYSVEDDEDISYIINKTLSNSGYNVKSFLNGKELFSALKEELPNIILLDIMLPEMSGLEILKSLKKNEKYKDVIIIIISAKDSEIDMVNGLDLGADDYIAKPFGILELVSRINAHTRRIGIKDNSILTFKDIRMNVEARTCHKGDVPINLTFKEYDLLRYLLEHKNKAVSREELLNKIWGFDYIGETRTLDMHIKTLRAKLDDHDEDNRIIQSIRSVGYKISDEK